MFSVKARILKCISPYGVCTVFGLVILSCFGCIAETKPKTIIFRPKQVIVESAETGVVLNGVTVQIYVHKKVIVWPFETGPRLVDEYVSGPFPGNKIQIKSKVYFDARPFIDITIGYLVSAPGYDSATYGDLPHVVRLSPRFPGLHQIAYKVIGGELGYADHHCRDLSGAKDFPQVFYDCDGTILQATFGQRLKVVRALGHQDGAQKAQDLLNRL